MRVPKFTAERSLERANQHYRTRPGPHSPPNLASHSLPGLLTAAQGFTSLSGCYEACSDLYEVCLQNRLMGCDDSYRRCERGCEELYGPQVIPEEGRW